MNYIELAQSDIAERYPRIVYWRPPIAYLPSGAILGTWTYSIPGEVRYILDKQREIAPGVMPGDLARTWIKDQYLLPMKRRKDQMIRGYTVPLYAKRGVYGPHSYVDIKSAYLRVLQLGYDLEYKLGSYIGAEPRSIPDEVKNNKFTYAIAVAMSGPKISTIDIKGKDGIFKHHPMNVFSNPCLYNLAQDTLCAIGSELLSVLGDHIVYYNTDGAIVECGYEQYAIDIVASWGFEARIKSSGGELLQGDTEIRGVGSYRIGSFQTRRYDDHAEDYVSDLMPADERRWLKTRWSLWAAKLT